MSEKLKVLIVDDQEYNLQLYSRILKAEGYETEKTTNGLDAIKILEADSSFSIILMDIQMSGMDGFETVERIKKIPKACDIPTIFITGIFETEEFKLRGFDIGAYDYLIKPFESNVLIRKIKLFTTLYHQKLELEKYGNELRARNEELDITLKSLSEGVLRTDREFNVLMMNSAAKNIFGILESKDSGFNLISLFEQHLEERSIVKLKEFINKNETEQLKHLKFNLSINNEKSKIISININIINTENEKKSGYVFIISDITGKIQIENQLALSQKMESVGQLAAGIAHEINTPMQFIGDNTYFLNEAFESINNYSNSLRDSINKESDIEKIRSAEADLWEENDIEFLIEEVPTAIDRTMKGVERVRDIVMAMKNFAHPSGKKKMPSNINKGIEVTATISKNEWKYVADLETEFDENMPAVYCSLDEINQVVLNMIINAVHAIEEKNGKGEKGKISIRTSHVEKSAYIEISDSGNGIQPDKLYRIFDPFFTTKEVGKGTGQGLAIAHDIIVNKHSGKIRVDSEVGKGTKFIIELPVI